MKRLIVIVLATLPYFLGIGLAPAIAATPINCGSPGLTAKQQIQCSACDAAANTTCTPGDATGSVNSTIKTIVNLLTAVAGVAAVIMIIVGGLRYVTSAGSADASKSAKNTILYAVVGLVIVALAQLIVHFTLHTTTQVTDCTNGKTSSGQSC